MLQTCSKLIIIQFWFYSSGHYVIVNLNYHNKKTSTQNTSFPLLIPTPHNFGDFITLPFTLQRTHTHYPSFSTLIRNNQLNTSRLNVKYFLKHLPKLPLIFIRPKTLITHLSLTLQNPLKPIFPCILHFKHPFTLKTNPKPSMHL